MSESKYFQSYRREMLEFVPTDATRILEVGCGEGAFGQQLASRQGAEVWGVEPNAAAARMASTKLHQVETRWFDETIAAPRSYFDCVVFNDVLEHMEDPWSALSFSKKLLRGEHSVVVASIPNFRYWHNLVDVVVYKNFEYGEEGILDKTHLRFFTENSIRGLFAKTGFEILEFTGINPTESKLFKTANLALLNGLRDMRFMQFGIVATPVRS
jgi:2-polyprenyl-3-methyl-5-hydroxy-6-metoxy-1,4-benzoquinol methylase